MKPNRTEHRSRVVLFTCFFAFAGLVILPISSLTAQTNATWLGGNGSWSDAANWSTNPDFPNNGQPNPSDLFNVVINAGTAALDTDVTIEELNFSGGFFGSFTNNRRTIVTNDVFTWSGGTRGIGTSVANGGIELVGGSDKVLTGGIVLNQGITNQRGGDLLMSTVNAGGFPPTIVPALVKNSGTWNADSNVVAGGTGAAIGITGVGKFQNLQTFNQSGTQTTTLSTTFENLGNVFVNAGRLKISGSGNDVNGSYFSNGGTLDFAGGIRNLDATSLLDVNSTVEFNGGTFQHFGATLLKSGGKIDVLAGDITLGSVAQTGGKIVGIQNVNIDGLLQWSTGSHRGTATTFANGGIEFTGSGFKTISDARTIEAGATTNFRGGNLRLENTSVFRNTGTFNADSDIATGGTGADLNISRSFGDVVSFENDGTFNQSGSQTTTMGVAFINSGTVDVQSGILSFTNGGTGVSGVFSVQSGATLRNTVGTYTLDGTTLSGNGTLHAKGGQFKINSTGNQIGNLLQDGGSAIISGTGNLVVNNLWEWSKGVQRDSGTTTSKGTLELTSSSFKKLDDGRTVRNEGLTNFRGGNLRIDGGSIFQNVGTFIADSNIATGGTGADLTVSNSFGNSATFENSGVFRQVGNQTTDVRIDYTNSGTIDVESGRLIVGNFSQTGGITRVGGSAEIESGLVLDFQAGLLEGIGLIDSRANIGGTLSPGFTGFDETGQLSFEENLTMLPGSVLEIELAGFQQGVEFDFIEASLLGTTDVSLDGTLSVRLLDSFESQLTSHELFTVLKAGDELLGAFDNVANGGRLSTFSGHSFQVNYGVGSIFSTNELVLSNFQPIPEPGSGCILFLFASTLVRRRPVKQRPLHWRVIDI